MTDGSNGTSRKDWGRIILGANGITGTLLVILYIALFSLTFGSIFYLLQ